MMYWILDIAAAAVLIGGMINGKKKGFVRTVLGVVLLIVAIFGASLIAERLTAPVTNWLQPIVQDKVWPAIQKGRSANLEGLPQVVIDLVDGALAAGESAAVAMVKGVVYNIVHTVLFVLSFVALRFVLQPIFNPLTRGLNKIPLVGGVNQLLGAAAGLLCGALLLYVVIWALQNFRILKPEIIAATHLVRFFANYSLVELFNELLAVKDRAAAFIGGLK